MSDWQVGDLALCVSDKPCSCCGSPMPVSAGRVYRVTAAWIYERLNILLLDLEGVNSRITKHTGGIDARKFRKIRPDKHEACEPEFVTLLKRVKRTVIA